MSNNIQSFYKAHPQAIIAGVSLATVFGTLLYRAGSMSNVIERLGLLFSANDGTEKRIVSKEERLLKHVLNRAAEGNPKSVLDVIDDFGHRTEWLMNVGDEKGILLKNEVVKKQPKIALELGTYLGQSIVSSTSTYLYHLFSR